MVVYFGRIYVAVPFDRTLPEYCKLEVYLENPDGSVRQPDTYIGISKIAFKLDGFNFPLACGTSCRIVPIAMKETKSRHIAGILMASSFDFDLQCDRFR
jgi:hypothetical protein